MGEQFHWLEVEGPIPVENWGRDHTSTLLFAETQAVDNHGYLDGAKMRTARNYPTRLANGDEIVGHTDYDCLTDAGALGFLSNWPTEDNPGQRVVFTDKGWAYVSQLRRERAEAGLEVEIPASAKAKYERGGTRVPV